MALSAKEIRLAGLVNFDLEVCRLLKEHARKPLDRAMGVGQDLRHVPIDGVSLRVKGGDEAERIMTAIQPALLAKGYRAFWSVRRAANGERKGDEVIVLKTKEHFAIVKSKMTDGANYGISTKAILARLRGWEKRCRFEIVGASQDWVAVVFHSLPKDLCGFAEEVYRFCPDTVDQGVGLMRESEDSKAFAAARRYGHRGFRVHGGVTVGRLIMSENHEATKSTSGLKRIANSKSIFKLEAEEEFAVRPVESAARRPLARATETRAFTVLELEDEATSTSPRD